MSANDTHMKTNENDDNHFFNIIDYCVSLDPNIYVKK